ncbi:MAG: hypothetical protein BWZ03_00132 [bacterium ADurb.BinA186]|nr:MAG: hypothetical protein BWZ03_00132 [bacterium ADurb.BinA186]
MSSEDPSLSALLTDRALPIGNVDDGLGVNRRALQVYVVNPIQVGEFPGGVLTLPLTRSTIEQVVSGSTVTLNLSQYDIFFIDINSPIAEITLAFAGTRVSGGEIYVFIRNNSGGDTNIIYPSNLRAPMGILTVGVLPSGQTTFYHAIYRAPLNLWLVTNGNAFFA